MSVLICFCIFVGQNSLNRTKLSKIETSYFKVESGVTECHAMVHTSLPSRIYSVQLEDIQCGLGRFLDENKTLKPAFMRFFVSDITTQDVVSEAGCPVSVIEQPPLDGSAVALWVYLKSSEAGHYRHLWTAGMSHPEGDLYGQTATLLRGYADSLTREGLSFADNCVRTWIFVRDIDHNYQDVVRARREFFASQGLTEHTHYIASTGIAGNGRETASGVVIDAYAVGGLQAGQQRYLHAPTHLNPTHEYGVTFERGVVVEYGDRSHIFISGTASINNRGEIVHPGDIEGQTRRMLENIEALLNEADASFDDVMMMIVYLRNSSDYVSVNAVFDSRFPTIPKVITLAPICRPGWLVETECIAVKRTENKAFKVL